MATRERLFIGLASGAAADGVDAALVSVRGRREKMKPRPLHHLHRPYSEALRNRLCAACAQQALPPGEKAALDRDVALAFGGAARSLLEQSKTCSEDVGAIGFSAQRIGYVAPSGLGRPGGVAELGRAAVLAREAQLPVVAGFAESDLAAGGCGGPVTVWADWLVLKDKRLSRVAVYLGGIAALTFVGTDAAPCDVVAFDVGPGTIVLDALARELFDRPFDADGSLAAKGKVHEALLNELLANPYFRREPPKLVGTADWGPPYLKRLKLQARKRRCEGRDLLATAAELTARSVADAIATLTERPHQVVLTGGGAKNIHLAMRIRSLMSPSSTITCERFGLDVRAKQAVCYVILAAARIDKFAAHCHCATGASRPAVLGSIWLP